METINKYRYDKKTFFENEAGAKFYLNKDGANEESYFHICDHIQPQYMPEIYRHDVHNSLYLGDKYIRINYCPICGKKL